MTYTKLIERLKSDIALTPVSAIAREAADAIEALQSAVRTLEHIGYTNHGGEYWQPPVSNAATAVSVNHLQAENERLKAELDKAQEEINCAESSLEAFSCEFGAEVFDQGFDCLGDFVQALWAASNGQRDQLQAKLDAMGKGEPVIDFTVLHQFASDQAISYNKLCTAVRMCLAAPKALAPLTDKEDWDIRGILASKLRVFHRTTEAEADELISLFASMKSRTPLTQPEVVEAFCNTRHNTQYVSVFDAGVRFAEKHHGIGGTP